MICKIVTKVIEKKHQFLYFLWLYKLKLNEFLSKDDNGRSAILPNTPVAFEEARKQAFPAPHLGEHSREILREYGYTDEEIEEYIAGGIVKVHTAT